MTLHLTVIADFRSAPEGGSLLMVRLLSLRKETTPFYPSDECMWALWVKSYSSTKTAASASFLACFSKQQFTIVAMQAQISGKLHIGLIWRFSHVPKMLSISLWNQLICLHDRSFHTFIITRVFETQSRESLLCFPHKNALKHKRTAWTRPVLHVSHSLEQQKKVVIDKGFLETGGYLSSSSSDT